VWCDTTVLFESYWNPFRCILVILYVLQPLCNLSFTFCLLYENVVIKVCNGQFVVLLFETWFIIWRKELILRAFNNIVMGDLDRNRAEGMGGG
jgi:hypothetical protein